MNFPWKPWRSRLALLAVLLAPSVAAAAAEADCALPAARVIAESGDAHAPGGRLLQVWDLAAGPVWWSQAEPEGYGALRAEIAAQVGETDPVKLLTGQGSSEANNRVVAANAAAWVRPANCLEKALNQLQTRRLPMFEAPTEFMAVVLRSADGARLRVYFYTVNADGIGRATPVTDLAMADRRAGWSVLAALHNHAFHPGQPLLNGPIAPSGPDAQFNVNFAERAGMAEAWITNGLHTARIPASAFGQFERDGP